VIVLLLMGSVLYEVTRTESFGRQSAARTQDIALPAPQPVTHTVRASANFIGSSTVGRNAVQPVQPDREFLAITGYGSAAAHTPAAFRSNASFRRFGDFTFNGRSFNGRAHSSNSSGYAAGSYGMGGVGAWGGVSGVTRPGNRNGIARRANAERPARNAQAPRRPGNGSGGNGGGATSVAGNDTTAPVTGSLALNGGFTTGAAAIEPGAVVTVGASAAPALGPAPAPTPEPMSLLLVGTGLAALFTVRQRLQ
jgi:hypothetical protein